MIDIKYKEEPKELTPEQEEMETFLERVIDTNYSKKEIAIKNFAKEFWKILSEKWKIPKKEKMKLII